MNTLLHDIRYSLRVLIKNPGFSLVALLALALGIGANSAIFSVVDGVLLRQLAYGDPDRLVMVWATQGAKGQDTVVPADFLDWRRQSKSFQQLAGFGHMDLNLVGRDGPERVDGLSVTGNFFRVLGVRPMLGRDFLAAPGAAAEGPVAVLGYGLWRRAFGGDAAVLGQKVRLSDKPCTIVGVMPPGFTFHDAADLWVAAPRDVPELPVDVGGDPATMRGLSYMRAFGRLAPGVSLGAARQEMAAIAARQAREFPATNAFRGIRLVPMADELVGNVRAALWVLFGAVAFVLVIACVNVANLLLVRAASRRREIAVRIAQGSSRGRLARQLVTESLILGLTAGACGLLLGWWGTRALVGLAPGDIPRLGEVSIDAPVLAFTLAVSLLSGLLLGMLPLLQTRRLEIVEALKQGGRSTDSRGQRRVRDALVVAEVAAATVLLIGAGVMLKSFAHLRDVRPGFDRTGVLAMDLSLPRARYGDKVQQAAFFDQLLDRLRRLPGVKGAGAVLDAPLAGDDVNLSFSVEGRPRPPAGAELRDGFQVVSYDYFRTLGIPLLQGRRFTAADVDGAPRVAVLSEAMARRYWQGESPVGSRLTFGKPDSPAAKWYTVVGVVGNVHHEGPGSPARAEAYVPYPQWPWSAMSLVVRTAGDPHALVPAIRKQVRAIDPSQPISALHTMDELLSMSTARPRLTSSLLSAFAALALFLAAVGIYGVMAYSVTQRTSEIGLRLALGAQRVTVLREVVGRGMLLALTGVAIGIAGAGLLTRFLRGMVFDVSVTDAATFATAPLVLLAVALAANLLPAQHAAGVDPALAMKHE